MECLYQLAREMYNHSGAVFKEHRTTTTFLFIISKRLRYKRRNAYLFSFRREKRINPKRNFDWKFCFTFNISHKIFDCVNYVTTQSSEILEIVLLFIDIKLGNIKYHSTVFWNIVRLRSHLQLIWMEIFSYIWYESFYEFIQSHILTCVGSVCGFKSLNRVFGVKNWRTILIAVNT